MKRNIAFVIFTFAFNFSLAAGVFDAPALTDHRINLVGSSPGQGVVGFSRIQDNQADSGHDIISLNANHTDRAYYYLVGHEHTAVAGAGDTAHFSSFTGMDASSAFFTGVGWDPTLLTFQFGNNGGATTTWNLGGDVNGVNWFGNAGSAEENRIYEANPANVSAGLWYNNTKVISFDYSPLYLTIQYSDRGRAFDVIRAHSLPIGASEAGGLIGNMHNLASSILTDIQNNGGQVQLNFHNIQSSSRQDFADANFGYGIFSFDAAIQVVPEPATASLCTGLILLAGAFVRRYLRILR